ncbi:MULTISPECIES: hypothetical protein [unclassified Streptomyces]|uniref:hypothetical protein n=1 Tax=unclassified Streptomyces TaxID=2593676 RepID=UPI00203530D4|nr:MULTISPECIES: hypothetical protein [unclassified Streptomyces]
MKAGNIDLIRIRAGKVESRQQGQGRLPGHRFVMDAVTSKEVSCFLRQCLGQLRCLKRQMFGRAKPDLLRKRVLLAR